MNKKGFTLVELSIAAGLLSLVIIAGFAVFNNSGKAFSAGSWRLARQQEAQRFLLKFKENIEKASNAYEFTGNSNNMIASIPISISTKYNNMFAASTESTGVLYTSSVTPIQQVNQELGINIMRKGIWKGYSLECRNNVLSFTQTGKVAQMHADTPGNIRNNANITKGNLSQDFSISLSDVASIGVFIAKATDSVDLKTNDVLLTLKVGMVMPKSKGQTTVTEEITAIIHDKDIEHNRATFIRTF